MSTEQPQLQGFPPRLFIIGAQKAGTTYLANLLDQHPDIVLSDVKEADYFARRWQQGLDWYRGMFSNGEGRVLLDASPSYAAAPLADYGDDVQANTEFGFQGVPRRIHEISPQAKFIYLMRDPVVRTHSSYWHAIRAGYESRPFRAALQENSVYLRQSNYIGQLNCYLEYFPRSSFLPLVFEDFRKDPVAAAKRCFEFAGVGSFTVQKEAGRNESFVYRPGFAGLNNTLRMINRFVPQGVKDWARPLITQKVPKLTDEDAEYLAGLFKEPNQRLQTEWGIDTSQWKT